MSAAVIDTESDDLLEGATRFWCASSCSLDGDDTVSSWDEYSPHFMENFLEHIDSNYDEIVGHNIVGHDLPLIEKLTGWKPNENTTLTDTLLLSRLSNPDRRKPTGYTGKGGPHSLDCWGYRVRRYKPGHEDWAIFSPAMLRRNREDVAINRLAAHLISSEMSGHDWSEAVYIEHEVQRIQTKQEIHGVKFDSNLAHKLISQLDNSIRSIDNELLPKLPTSYKQHGVSVNRPFLKNGHHSKMSTDWYPPLSPNDRCIVGGPFTRLDSIKLDINSIHQIKAYFLKCGWIPDEYNYSKKTGQPTSPKLTESSYDSITSGMGPQIKRRLTLRHRRGQIQGWIDRLRDDGRLTAGAITCGTPTGRFRHFNVANVPKAADHVFLGKEMRSLFTVPPGYNMVGTDAAQIELRLLAHYLNDYSYIQEILHGDIHSYNQQLAGLPTRDDAKTFIYALIYGGGDAVLGLIVGGDETDGARLRRRFLRELPGFAKLLRRVKSAADKGWLKGLDGRKLFIRREEGGRVKKNIALNVLIQGADAVVMKKASIILDELATKEGLHSRKVIDYHDEFQWECPWIESKRIAELSEIALVKAGEHFNLNIPIAADSSIGYNWSETH